MKKTVANRALGVIRMLQTAERTTAKQAAAQERQQLLESYGRQKTLYLLQNVLNDLCAAAYKPPTARQCKEALRDLSQKDKAELRAKNLDKAR